MSEQSQEHKRDEGKPRPSLVYRSFVLAVARVREHGLRKYVPESWRSVSPERYVDAALRHLLAHADGEINDAESGLSHLAHCAANLMFLIEGGATERDDVLLCAVCHRNALSRDRVEQGYDTCSACLTR